MAEEQWGGKTSSELRHDRGGYVEFALNMELQSDIEVQHSFGSMHTDKTGRIDDPVQTFGSDGKLERASLRVVLTLVPAAGFTVVPPDSSTADAAVQFGGRVLNADSIVSH